MRILGIAVMQLVIIFMLYGSVVGMEYPKEVAADFPACEGAQILQTMNVQGSMMVMMEYAGSMEDVYGDYKKVDEDGGWSILMETKQPEVIILMGEKGKKRLILNVGADNGKTMVSLTVGTGK